MRDSDSETGFLLRGRGRATKSLRFLRDNAVVSRFAGISDQQSCR